MTVSIQGTVPQLHNRDDLAMLDPVTFTRKKNESWDEFEERVWRCRAHYETSYTDENPVVVIRDTWIKRAMISSQKQSGLPIMPPGSKRKTDSLRNYIVSGILIENSPIYLNNKVVKKADLVPFKSMVRHNKTSGKTPCTRPMIPTGWTATIKFIITDEAIKESNVRDIMEWVGIYNGIGDWRVERGGQFGRFKLIDC
jgi:hypothetical protein